MTATVPAIKASRRAKHLAIQRMTASLSGISGITCRSIDYGNSDVLMRIEGHNRLVLVAFTLNGTVYSLDIDDDTRFACNDSVDLGHNDAVEIMRLVFGRGDWHRNSQRTAKAKLDERDE